MVKFRRHLIIIQLGLLLALMVINSGCSMKPKMPPTSVGLPMPPSASMHQGLRLGKVAYSGQLLLPKTETKTITDYYRSSLQPLGWTPKDRKSEDFVSFRHSNKEATANILVYQNLKEYPGKTFLIVEMVPDSLHKKKP